MMEMMEVIFTVVNQLDSFMIRIYYNMKKLFIFLLSIFISLSSYGEFKEIGTNNQGKTYYVDNETVIEDNGYIYFLMLTDYRIPFKGFLSDKTYMKGSCSGLRYMPLSATAYQGQMGRGGSQTMPDPPQKWIYIKPDTIGAVILGSACYLIETIPFIEDWKLISATDLGNPVYVKSGTIKEGGGYVYFEVLTDHIKPDEFGDRSVKTYIKGDCRLNRQKYLSGFFSKKQMGQGPGETITPPDEWEYPLPTSAGGYVLSWVCDYVK